MTEISRRKWIQFGAGAALGGAVAPAQQSASTARMIGIQVGAISFVDEGVDAVLDNFQKLGAVNTLFVATFTYGRGIAGRQVPGAPFPDHGKPEEDRNFRGGFYTTPHLPFYRDTALKPEQAAEIPANFDVLSAILPRTKARGLKVYCWYEDVFRRDTPGFDSVAEVDLHGRPGDRPCYRNPQTRAFWLGQVEDYLRSYEVDGLMFGSERQGPLGNAIGARHGGTGSDPGRVACFCQHCLTAARQEGINTDRARAGYTELEKLVAVLRKGSRPSDGAFVSFWRVLVNYPEVLAWERLWTEGLRDTYRAQYQRAHEIKPQTKIGWHIWHNNTFSPFYRAEQDYAELSKTADFFKVVIYNNCGGPRMASYAESVSRTIFADFPPERVLAMNYRFQQLAERPLAEIPTRGLSADYVFRETRRALATTAARTQVWPGIDVDIPTSRSDKQTVPDDVYDAVTAAFSAGAHGVLLSRKYSEMKLGNLAAAGRAVRDLRLA